jgi:hypothetical protein
MLRCRLPIALVVASVIAPATASAQLRGARVGVQVQFPAQGTVWQDLGAAVVNPGVEFASNRGEQIHVTATGFTYSLPGSGSFTDFAFNGVRLFDPGNSAPEFLSVSILGSTGGFTGFDMSRVTFDADNIYVNAARLVGPGSVTFAVMTASTVPEPSTWALLGTGLLTLGGITARRRKRADARGGPGGSAGPTGAPR